LEAIDIACNKDIDDNNDGEYILTKVKNQKLGM